MRMIFGVGEKTDNLLVIFNRRCFDEWTDWLENMNRRSPRTKPSLTLYWEVMMGMRLPMFNGDRAGRGIGLTTEENSVNKTEPGSQDSRHNTITVKVICWPQHITVGLKVICCDRRCRRLQKYRGGRNRTLVDDRWQKQVHCRGKWEGLTLWRVIKWY